MSSIYVGVSDADLESWKSNFFTQYMNVKHTEGQETVRDKWFEDYRAVCEELEKRTKTKASLPCTTMTAAESNMLKDVRMAEEQITTLAPGGDAASYLSDLDNVYKLYLTGYSKFEPNFVRLAKQRLCQAYLTTVTNSTVDTSKFDDYKAFVRKSFGSKRNIYQSLDTLFDLTLEGDVQDFSVNLENHVARVQTEIEDHFEQNSESKSRNVSHAEMFQLLGVMILLRQVKSVSGPAIYNSIVTGLEKCVTINDANLKVKTYMDQAEKVDEIGHDSSKTFHATQNQQKRQDPRRRGSRGGNATKGDSESRGAKNCYNIRDYGQCKRPMCHFEPCKSKPRSETEPTPSANYSTGNFYNAEDFQLGTLDQ